MSKDTITRAVTIPVVSPADSGTWKELWSALHAAWRESTCLANWAMTELAKADVVRMPSDGKMPKMAPIYLYGLAGKQYSAWQTWKGMASCANSILRMAEKKYRSMRYKVAWTREASLPGFRYPAPYPIHNKAWKISFSDGNEPLLSVPLGNRWTLRLKGGLRYHRQTATLRKIAAGEYKQCEMQLLKKGDDIMAKLVYQMPRPEPVKSVTLMTVTTYANRFLVAEIDGRQPWILNADHVKRMIAAHKEFLQRFSDDMKAERRANRIVRKDILEALDVRCSKQNNRLKSFAQEAASWVCNFAARNKVATIAYDDSGNAHAACRAR